MSDTVIFTENNAFLNFGKCLQKQCANGDQAKDLSKDFLQFCIEFIFYDKTHIAGTVPNGIRNDTNQIIEVLKNYGFPGDIISPDKDYSEDILCPLAKIMEENIDEWIKKVQPSPYPIIGHIKGRVIERKIEEYLPTLREEERKMIYETTEAVKRGEKAFNKFIEDITQSPSLAETFYFKVFKDNENIIRYINSINTRWTVAMTMNVISNIRYYANRELARKENHYFLPSHKRGKRDLSLRKKELKHPYVSKMIRSAIFESKKEPAEFNIKMPVSITKYIEVKGHYQPENIIKEVMDLRYEFQPVRDYIRKYVGKESYGEEGVFQNELDDIAQQVFDKLKIDSSNRYVKPVENLVTVRGMNVKVPDPDGLKNTPKSICVQAFTEIINDMNDAMGYHSKMLIKNCIKK